MNTENLRTAVLLGRTPSISASPRGEEKSLVGALVAIVLSLLYRRERPPDIPPHLRADLGLDYEYKPQTWYDLDQRTSFRKRDDHE